MTLAYTNSINSNTSDSHQVTPAYVLTFVRWTNRDTLNYRERPPMSGKPKDQYITRNPLVVISDCVQLEISNSKKALTSSINLQLKSGDINYATSLSPGDYLLVNLLNDEEHAIKIAEKARNSEQINKYGDGFKGLFKIQKVRRKIQVNPQNGVKTYFYVIHGFGFSELNTVVYYNPTAAATFKESEWVFLKQFSEHWAGFMSSLTNAKNVQKSLQTIIRGLLSIGMNSGGMALSTSQNSGFKIPPKLGGLLGKPRAKTILDIYNFVFGVWKGDEKATTIEKGFNPNITQLRTTPTFFVSQNENKSRLLQGYKVFASGDFNCKQIWSILSSYSNNAVNEGYTATRVDINGDINPTIIFRQKPFSSEHFDNPIQVNGKKGKGESLPHTKFFELPRWKISPDLIYSVDLGKDEIARVNYLQLYGRSVSYLQMYNDAFQATNVYFDPEDIKRHGMKPAIVESDFDFWQTEGKKGAEQLVIAKKWAYLLFDMLNAGQLRESGAIVCQGIREPIEVGDNLEFDNCVYHIEGVTHSMAVAPNGMKQFRTVLSLSFGTSLDSTNVKPVYPQMQHTDAIKERERDKEKEGILPGVSDTQDIPYAEGKSRIKGEKIVTSDSSFVEEVSDKLPGQRFSTLQYKTTKKTDDKKKGDQ